MDGFMQGSKKWADLQIMSLSGDLECFGLHVAFFRTFWNYDTFWLLMTLMIVFACTQFSQTGLSFFGTITTKLQALTCGHIPCTNSFCTFAIGWTLAQVQHQASSQQIWTGQAYKDNKESSGIVQVAKDAFAALPLGCLWDFDRRNMAT